MLFPLKKQMRIPPVKKIHLKKQKLYPKIQRMTRTTRKLKSPEVPNGTFLDDRRSLKFWTAPDFDLPPIQMKRCSGNQSSFFFFEKEADNFDRF